MDNVFDNILTQWASEDGATLSTFDGIVGTAQREFANFDEVRASADGVRLVRIPEADDDVLVFPITPIRRVDALHIRNHNTSQRPYRHSHDFFELVYYKRGGGCQIAGEDGSDCRLCRAGDVCVIPLGVPHAMSRPKEGDVILKIDVPRELFVSALPPECVPSFIDVRVADVGFDALVVRLICEFCSERALRERICEHLAALALLALADRNGESDESQRLLDDFFERRGLNATLADYARERSFSVDYAAKTVKRASGKTFSQHAEERKLRRAAELLVGGDMPVEAVAAECGYRSPSGLYKRFSAVYGMTPGQYRDAFGIVGSGKSKRG